MLLRLLLVLCALGHIWLCPFTKVEESFNMQACHDLIYNGPNLDKYDHLEFPGVVPRSFLGPIIVSSLSAPFTKIAEQLELSHFSSQLIVRSTLAVIVSLAFIFYAKAVREKFGNSVRVWLYLITVSQFHILFYMGRTLPNTFALALTLLAAAFWLKSETSKFIWTSSCAILIFRSELSVFLGLMLLYSIFKKNASMKTVILTGLIAAPVWIGLSVLVDSVFWKRWLWPEAEVLYYNTILNKSSDWGTSPFFWYFFSVIPRALLTSMFAIPIALYYEKRSPSFLFPCLGFIFIYSFLPHKELRFIIYTFPLLNTVAAMGCSRIWHNKGKSCTWTLAAVLVGFHLLANLIATNGLLYVSQMNYPGGKALQMLHHIEPADSNVHVHIDIPSAQTGITRFTQVNPQWVYDKTENLAPSSEEMMSFTHLLIGDEDQLKFYKDSHTIIGHVTGFNGIKLEKFDKFPFFDIAFKQFHILKKNVLKKKVR